MNSKDLKVLSDAGLIIPINKEFKELAYDLIRKIVKNPFDYVNEDREDLITLGAIYGMIRIVDAIYEKEDQK